MVRPAADANLLIRLCTMSCVRVCYTLGCEVWKNVVLWLKRASKATFEVRDPSGEVCIHVNLGDVLCIDVMCYLMAS